jgi:hypothetical protein
MNFNIGNCARLEKPVQQIKKHKLICKIEGANDMGHLMFKRTFENNHKMLRNFEQIKKDIDKFWYDNNSKLISIDPKVINGVGYIFYKLKNPNIKTLETTLIYDYVEVKIIMSLEGNK